MDFRFKEGINYSVPYLKYFLIVEMDNAKTKEEKYNR